MRSASIRRASLVWAAVATWAGCSSEGASSCPSGQTICGDLCYDTQVDESHCGACGAACGTGEECHDGVCTATSPPTCDEPLSPCGDGCVDLQTDLEHCGSCDVACEMGQSCVEASCVPICSPETQACGDACVDVQTDPLHCGGCDVACLGTSDCHEASCQLLCDGRPCAGGTHLFSTAFGNDLGNFLFAIDQGADGSIAIGGSFAGTYDLGGGPTGGASEDSAVIATLNPDGSFAWGAGYGDTDAATQAVAIGADGGVVAVGRFTGTIDFGDGQHASAGDTDAFLVAFDAAGTLLFSRTFGDAGSEVFADVDVDEGTQDIVVSGYFTDTIDLGNGSRTSAGGYDLLVARFDAMGNAIWDVTAGDVDSQLSTAISSLPDGGVVAGSYFYGTMDLGGGPLVAVDNAGAYVVRLDAAGNHVWSNSYDDVGFQNVRDVAVDANDDVFIVGAFETGIDLGGTPLTSAGLRDVFVAKLAGATGAHVWSERFGGAAMDIPYGMGVIPGGDIALGGHFQETIDFGGGAKMAEGADDYDVFVARLAGDGAHVWSADYGGASHEFTFAFSVGAEGRIVAVGRLDGTADFGGGPITTAGQVDGWLAAFAP